MRVLLIEDDIPLGDAVASYLTEKGMTVDRATTVAQARASLPMASWGAVLVDLHLPDGDGLVLVGETHGRCPDAAIIILTARDQVSDRVRGLNAGADDYLVKPFDPDELLARLRAVERRRHSTATNLVTVGDLDIDLVAMSVARQGESIALTAKEWSLLRLMASRPDRVLRKESLLQGLYGFDDEISSNTVEVFICNLRRKLGSNSIRTIRGLGYRLMGGAER